MAKTSRTHPHLLSGLYPRPCGRNPNGKVWGYKRGWIPDPALKTTCKNTNEVKAVVEEVKGDGFGGRDQGQGGQGGSRR